MHTTSAHAVRRPRPACLDDADLLGHVEPTPQAPRLHFAFFRAPLHVERKPFVSDNVIDLARTITRLRARRAIQLTLETFRPVTLGPHLDGLAVRLLDLDGQPTDLLGFAYLGGGRHSRSLLQSALYEVDPPVAGEPTEFVEAA